MSAMKISRRRWLLVHSLLVLSFAALVYMIVLNIRFAATRELPQPTAPEHLLIGVAVPSVFWLWAWMLTDFFLQQGCRSFRSVGLVSGAW